MNPYETFVGAIAQAVREGRSHALGGIPPLPKPELPVGAPKVLIFSPHPDDEVIMGGLPLRLLRESNWEVINVAVTLGSNKKRQPMRWKELEGCCDYIGFGLLSPCENGLEGVNSKLRAECPSEWNRSVERIAGILAAQKPRVIFFHHDEDWNSTHEGTHHLVMDALAQLGNDFSCFVVEAEFWRPMATPNLLVESSERDVADLIAALSFHVGEVERNPYHLRLPGWLMDNVRRGGELVGGQGGAAPDFLFGTIYRLGRWQAGRLESVEPRVRFVSGKEDPGSLFSGC